MRKNEKAELRIPKFFTIVEGGPWYRYDGKGYSLHQLRTKKVFNIMCRGFKSTVHSLVFGGMEDSGSPRWDVVNGWTNKRKVA